MESASPDSGLLEALSRLEAIAWSGEAWRYTFGANPADRTNLRGARWNPPGVEVLYASLERSTARAESDHILASQPLPPRVSRTAHRLAVRLETVLDLRDPAVLEALGVTRDALESDDHGPSHAVGRAAWFLGIDGLLVPSVRAEPGTNLVIIFSPTGSRPTVDVIESAEVEE